MTVPYMTLSASEETTRINQRLNPLEDPLNYGALADFSKTFELWAKLKTWTRKKKRTRHISPDASETVNQSALKAIVQN